MNLISDNQNSSRQEKSFNDFLDSHISGNRLQELQSQQSQQGSSAGQEPYRTSTCLLYNSALDQSADLLIADPSADFVFAQTETHNLIWEPFSSSRYIDDQVGDPSSIFTEFDDFFTSADQQYATSPISSQSPTQVFIPHVSAGQNMLSSQVSPATSQIVLKTFASIAIQTDRPPPKVRRVSKKAATKPQRTTLRRASAIAANRAIDALNSGQNSQPHGESTLTSASENSDPGITSPNDEATSVIPRPSKPKPKPPLNRAKSGVSEPCYCSCLKKFSSIKFLKEHIKIEPGSGCFLPQKCYHCSICEKTFKRTQECKRHILEHSLVTSRRGFHCEKCGCSFTRKHNLILHKGFKKCLEWSPDETRDAVSVESSAVDSAVPGHIEMNSAPVENPAFVDFLANISASQFEVDFLNVGLNMDMGMNVGSPDWFASNGVAYPSDLPVNYGPFYC